MSEMQKFINEWAIKNGGMPMVNAKVDNVTMGFYQAKFTEDCLLELENERKLNKEKDAEIALLKSKLNKR